MKFPKPFRKVFNGADLLAELNQRFDETARLADPAERLLQYRQLLEDGEAIRAKAEAGANVVIMPSAAAGMLMAVAGATTANPFLIFGGVAAIVGAVVAQDKIGRNALDAAGDVRRRSQAAIDGILNDPPMSGIASSRHYDRVMQTFPPLKEKFLAAAQEKPEAPPRPGNKPGFRL